MQKSYCSIYTFVFQYTAEEHNDWLEEDVTECVNLVLAYPPFNTCRKSNGENGSYGKLIDKEMKAFVDVVKKVLERG